MFLFRFCFFGRAVFYGVGSVDRLTVHKVSVTICMDAMSVLFFILSFFLCGVIFAAEAVRMEPLVSLDGIFDILRHEVVGLAVRNYDLLLCIFVSFISLGLVRSYLDGRMERSRQLRRGREAIERLLFRRVMNEAASRFSRYRDSRTEEIRIRRRNDFREWLTMVDPRIRETYDPKINDIETRIQEVSSDSEPTPLLRMSVYDGDVPDEFEQESRIPEETDEAFYDRYICDDYETYDEGRHRDVLRSVVARMRAESARQEDIRRRRRSNGDDESEE